MEGTLKVLSLLEGTKYSSSNDISVLLTAVDLFYHENKSFWERGTKAREQLNDLLSGEMIINSEAYIKSKNLDDLVRFIQGMMLMSLSLVNGIGRSPISARKDGNKINVKFQNKPGTIVMTSGKYNAETEKLVDEFKKIFYGKMSDHSFSANEMNIITEVFVETIARLKTEVKFIKKVEKDPTSLFDEDDRNHNFAGTLFLILSALPAEELNSLMINIGSYLPEDLEEMNEDNFNVIVRNYLTNSTSDMHELFKKIRLLLKLYFGKHREIIAIIVKEKTKKHLTDVLKNIKNLKIIKEHLATTIESQFDLRIKLLGGLVKLLK